VAHPRQDLPHPSCCLLSKVRASTASAWVFAHIPLALGRAAKYVDMAALGGMTVAPATAVQNLGPLLGGDQAVPLEEECLVGTPP
jgi:hypothetical protein